ncbi:hypothetical protein CIL05_16165 [Virgibacillus profundi]|uniref:4-hydroxy-3-methylbut-2-en-1-yl diphosphate synthase n=1 Tax=Virgibacillus profundi TaxID=2024555 RepID=A0A2A2IBG7_9BACI|nr:DUF1189 family protein [Virgibacillus profundi]PAV28470.1 hypothetical protein CIL05_16165 [Virgibacillus profundi]PXY52643.1 DUF1189 domain-containing protein [Virgibacillus profundi]
MIFLQAFVHSIKLPNKKAMFQLNRIGMDITVIYMFILLFLVSIPSLIDRLTATNGPGTEMSLFFLIIYFFIFYYLPLNIIVFIVLSIIAYIGSGIARLMRRKLRYSILWKMCAYTTTIPCLLYTVIALLFPVSDTLLWIFLIYTFVLLVWVISIYPKRKIRS